MVVKEGKWDKDCPACQQARGLMVITKDAHTCSICWACRDNEQAGKEVISILGHICGRSNEVGS